MGKQYTKEIVLKDRTFNSVKEFCDACGQPYWKWAEAKKHNVSAQAFYDQYAWKVQKEETKITIEAKEINEDNIIDADIVERKESKIISLVEVKKPTTNVSLRDIEELVKKINSLGIKEINLIDFENVEQHNPGLLTDYLDNQNVVNVFFYNATKHSNAYYSITMKSTSHNFQVLTMEVGSQLVDHLITFYLGILTTMMPHVKYNIISTDTGFSAFGHFMGVNVIGSVFVDNDNKFKYSLCKYIVDNREIRQGMSIAQNELNRIIDNFYALKDKKASSRNRKDVTDILTNLNIVELHEYGGMKYFEFNKNEATLRLTELSH